VDKSCNEVEVLLANESFIRWIEGVASDAEKKKWMDWLRDDPVHEGLVHEAKSIHFGFSYRHHSHSEIRSELDKLNKKIDLIEDNEARTNSFKSGQFKKYKYILYSAAAVFLVVALISSYSMFNGSVNNKAAQETQFVTVSTKFGNQKELTLRDGSKVFLNANSSLRIPKQSGKNYDLRLKGEAYFSISHNPEGKKREVTIHTEDGHISVVGTEFNVNTYKKGTEVVLKKGKVLIGVEDSTSDDTEMLQVMKPGQRSHFLANKGKASIHNVNTAVYISWITHKLEFDQTSVSNIATRLENIYGIRIEVDPAVKDMEITGSISNDNLTILLEGLEKILQVPIIKTKNKIRIG